MLALGAVALGAHLRGVCGGQRGEAGLMAVQEPPWLQMQMESDVRCWTGPLRSCPRS